MSRLTETRAPSTARKAPLLALLGADAVSQIGNVLANVAVPWFVLQTTGSAAKTGLVAAAVVLASVLAGFLGGPLVDRLGHRRTSVLADLSSGLPVAAVPLLHATVGIAFWQLLLLVFAGSFLDAPGKAARRAMLPELAERAGLSLERANAGYQTTSRLAQLLGPPLAGLLVFAVGASGVLWVDAATFVACAVVVFAAVPSSAPTEATTADDGPPAGPSGGGYFGDLVEGLRFVVRTPLILWVVLTYTVTEFLDAPLVAVALPVYAHSVLDSAPSLGLMIGGLGAGAVAGSVLYGVVGGRLERRRTFLLSLVVVQSPFLVLALSPPATVAVAVLFAAGAAAGPLNALLYTVIHERTPRAMIGRVFSAFGALGMAAVPCGMVLAGYLLEYVGFRQTLLGTAACYALACVVLWRVPALRGMDRPPAPSGAAQPSKTGPGTDGKDAQWKGPTSQIRDARTRSL